LLRGDVGVEHQVFGVIIATPRKSRNENRANTGMVTMLISVGVGIGVGKKRLEERLGSSAECVD
jgi:hypothetical protein